MFRATMIAGSLMMMSLGTAAAQTATTGLTNDAVYKNNCAKCHGKTGEGRHFGGPSLVSEKAASASPEDLRATIRNGSGRMPKYAGKLKAEEIDQLVQEIKGTKK